MKVQRKITDDVTVEADGSTLKEVFTELAALEECFNDKCCGVCKCTKTKFQVRKVNNFDFYEQACSDFKCRAKLAFGLSEGGKMYPKRMVTDDKGKAVKDENGKGTYLPDNGWVKYVKPG